MPILPFCRSDVYLFLFVEFLQFGRYPSLFRCLSLRELMGPVDPGLQLGIDIVGGGEHDMVGPSARIRLAFHGDPGRIDRLRQAQGQREEMRRHLRLPPRPRERHAPEHQPVEEGHLRLRHPDLHLRIPPHQLLLQGLI